MTSILFFDTNADLTNFAQNNPLPQSVFLTERFNDIPAKKLKKYTDAKIISVSAQSDILSNERLALFPNLKLIATRSTGFNHIDLNYCKQHKIIVSNVPHYGEATVAEFAMGLLLCLSRHIIQSSDDMARNRPNVPAYTGFELQGKTIGIIGTGSIGRHMIQLAQGFGMKVLAYDLFPNPALKKLYVRDLKKLYRTSDIISLHIPSTPQNHHLLDENAFREMKDGVVIINTARGDLIDTSALYAALKSGKIGGAGLDVLENEDFLLHDEAVTSPQMKDTGFLLDSTLNLRLMQFPNVIATPHIAFNTHDAVNRINTTAFKNIASFLNKKPINIVK